MGEIWKNIHKCRIWLKRRYLETYSYLSFSLRNCTVLRKQYSPVGVHVLIQISNVQHVAECLLQCWLLLACVLRTIRTVQIIILQHLPKANYWNKCYHPKLMFLLWSVYIWTKLISKHMPYKLWDEITHPLPNFNSLKYENGKVLPSHEALCNVFN